ncbi:hypothetical protein Hypma_015260 [Hypsizygus marmoreus]|uniref:Uncharacterized protein n=1 Tax=Hypsizygus marmoreus TaxID=39966 RepID=A0A369K310_HYPMA|nr:hypothetical protein Hypma_015260 [Hypsizygus marmoreus]
MHSVALVLSVSLVALHTTLALPVDNSGNAYTGPGGLATGGSVNGDPRPGLLGALLGGGLINVGSNNAGDGGIASSGGIGGTTPCSAKFRRWFHERPAVPSNDNNGNAYTGPGGFAEGGSVNTRPGLINIDSGNAGDAGDASSGSIGSAGFIC